MRRMQYLGHRTEEQVAGTAVPATHFPALSPETASSSPLPAPYRAASPCTHLVPHGEFRLQQTHAGVVLQGRAGQVGGAVGLSLSPTRTLRVLPST